MKNGGGHFAPKLGGHFELELGGQYHWNLQLTPADVYFGRGELILKKRERLKKMAIINRRNEY